MGGGCGRGKSEEGVPNDQAAEKAGGDKDEKADGDKKGNEQEQAQKGAGTEEGEEEQAAGDSAQARRPRERPTAVNAARVFRGELVVAVVAEGALRARRREEIRTEIPGRIEKLVAQ